MSKLQADAPWLFCKFSKSRYLELFKTFARYLEHPLSRTLAISNFSVGPLGVRDNERRLYIIFEAQPPDKGKIDYWTQFFYPGHAFISPLPPYKVK